MSRSAKAVVTLAYKQPKVKVFSRLALQTLRNKHELASWTFTCEDGKTFLQSYTTLYFECPLRLHFQVLKKTNVWKLEYWYQEYVLEHH